MALWFTDICFEYYRGYSVWSSDACSDLVELGERLTHNRSDLREMRALAMSTRGFVSDLLIDLDNTQHYTDSLTRVKQELQTISRSPLNIFAFDFKFRCRHRLSVILYRFLPWFYSYTVPPLICALHIDDSSVNVQLLICPSPVSIKPVWSHYQHSLYAVNHR